MLRRTVLASAAAFAGPALVAPFVARTALGQKARTVRMGTAMATTTNAERSDLRRDRAGFKLALLR